MVQIKTLRPDHVAQELVSAFESLGSRPKRFDLLSDEQRDAIDDALKNADNVINVMNFGTKETLRQQIVEKSDENFGSIFDHLYGDYLEQKEKDRKTRKKDFFIKAGLALAVVGCVTVMTYQLSTLFDNKKDIEKTPKTEKKAPIQNKKIRRWS